MRMTYVYIFCTQTASDLMRNRIRVWLQHLQESLGPDPDFRVQNEALLYVKSFVIIRWASTPYPAGTYINKSQEKGE
jgi:hypothetical protein